MTEENDTRPRRRRFRIAVALLGLVAVLLAGLWLARKPIAGRYVDRFLAEKGVAARYGIADLGLGRQRLVNVVLGDPADPDLVADWLEARTAIGLSGPYLTGVRGGRVRVRARVVDGRLSLGGIDRLLPKSNGGPFALPALALDVADLRARIETPWGLIGAKLAGSGRLDGGFEGQLAVTSRSLGAVCAARAPGAVVTVRTIAAAPSRAAGVRVQGSAEAAGLACAGMSGGYANVSGEGTLSFGPTISWTVAADVAGSIIRHPRATLRSVAGNVRANGGAGRIAGTTRLTGQGVAGAGLSARTLIVEGRLLRDPARRIDLAFDGTIATTDIDARALLPRVDAAALAGTPVAPPAIALTAALTRAAGRFGGDAAVSVATGPALTRASVTRAALTAASGARVTLGGGTGVSWASIGGLRGSGTVTVAGGGLPDARVALTQARPGRLRGVATIAPYAAGGGRLALTPVTFSRAADVWLVATTATLSGPLADGWVEGMTVPIDLRTAGRRLTLNPGCVPLGWTRLAISGLDLAPATVRLCPTGPALVSVDGARVSGGARAEEMRLAGRLGSTPLTLVAGDARLALADRRFALTGVQARLGRPDRLTRLDLATLDGTIGAATVGGRFAGAGGQIGAVPLLLSQAAGDWRFARGLLTVGGALTVSDAQADRPRFKPLPVTDVTLTLRGNAIAAAGSVRAPGGVREVAAVQLGHDLSSGTGGARFTVAGLVFDKALQPDQLTPVTFGVIADVRGTVTGDGRIDWTPAGVTSSGTFATTGTDLAAAFGPAQGIAGSIRFTDLLALESAPGQRLTVRSVNPGIAVTDGVVTFQTLRDSRIAVAGARWPFAGGTLTLLPTLLDFSAPVERRLTFRVEGAAADQFLQQFDFKNLQTTGTFDGELPMIFDEAGGRIAGGRLLVRPGGGTIAYVGPLGQKDMGFWPNLAFQALKSLRYRSLAITMDGPLAGEMVTQVRFAGVTQGEGARRGGVFGLLIGRLQRLPFVFNIRITAPFRGLLDATASFYDPRRLIDRNLPQLLDEQNKRAAPPAPAQPPVQPSASETVP